MGAFKTYTSGLVRCALLVLTLLLSERAALALGTHAGTVIVNQASVSYMVGAASFTVATNSNSITVAERLDVVVTWQDAAPVAVGPGQTNRATTFRITNTGNGNESFLLTATSALGGDNFDPSLVGMYLDTNGSNAYDPGVDTLYVPGVNDPALAPDAWTTVFVLNNIPGSGLNLGDTGNTRLTAASRTGTGAPGTLFAGMGDGGVDALAGSTGGTAFVVGTYVVPATTVILTKSASVLDPQGGTLPMTNAVVRYSIAVTVSGAGTASNVVITDPVPANTTYVGGTLRLNGVALTDAADADAGDVGATTPGTVTVRLGDLTTASPVQTIVFNVRIN